MRYHAVLCVIEDVCFFFSIYEPFKLICLSRIKKKKFIKIDNYIKHFHLLEPHIKLFLIAKYTFYS